MKQKKRIYLSGPISGRNPEECQAFAKAESKLQDMGFEVFNPLKISNTVFSGVFLGVKPWNVKAS